MATALVCGAVAGLAEFRPYATPDDLKGALASTGAAISDSRAPAVDLAAADDADAGAGWRQRHPIAFNGLDGKLRHGMPWNQRGAASVDRTWTRARWVDANLARARWVDANLARARWVEADWPRARWVTSDWAQLTIHDGLADPTLFEDEAVEAP